jgi:hypothetical protein
LGTCFIDGQGFARCNCNTGPTICLVPVADLQCIESYEVCLNAGITCNGTARCTDGLQCCGDFSVNPRVPYCGCDRGFAYDGTTCVSDVSTCAVAPCLISTTPAVRRWDLQATGAVTVEVIDEKGGDIDRYWDSDGNLQLYNDYGAPQCGSVSFSNGASARPGSYTFSTTPMRMAFHYAGKAYSSAGVGASGTMSINAVSWCKDFNCTSVNLTFAGTLTATDGTQVQVQGFVNGQDF